MTTYEHIAQNKRRSLILVAVFVVILGSLGWLFGQLLEFGYFGIAIALFIAVVMSLTSFYSGDSVALWTAGAKPMTKEDNPYVFRIVENLAITAGLPMPKIHLINDPAMNAFATGRDPDHASIAFTTGLVEKLENEELEAVAAHELSHIKNYDIRLMMIVIVLVGTLALLSHFFLRAQIFGGRRSRQGGQAGIILLIIGLALAILAPIIAQLIKLAISRRREFLADADGVLLTRYPAALANALRKLEANGQSLQRANPATAHLFLASPFGTRKKGLSILFSTHPPIADRIKALEQMGSGQSA
ncbi:MAG: M48 family metallopeptidase [Patescibacteria group bacterium]